MADYARKGQLYRVKEHHLAATNRLITDVRSSCFMKSANQIAESEAYMKTSDVKLAVYKIFCIAAKNHGQAFGIQIIIMQNLTAYEHLPEPMAELVAILVKEFDYAQLGEDLLREIAGKQFSGGNDTKSQRPFPRFLVKLSELCPRLVHKQMVLLQKHLDSEVCNFDVNVMYSHRQSFSLIPCATLSSKSSVISSER